MRVVERKLYIQDSATQTFIEYLDAETLTSTIVIDNCADDFIFTDDQRCAYAIAFLFLCLKIKNLEMPSP